MWILFVWRGNGLFALLPLIGLPALIFIPTVFMLEEQQRIVKSLPFFTEKVAMTLTMVAMFGGWFVGGMTCYLLGRRWNREENYHHLYFIPVQYLGIASCALEFALIAFVAGMILVNA
jgi:hypothetical protein